MRNKILVFAFIGSVVFFCHSVSSAFDTSKVKKQDQSFSTVKGNQHTENYIIYKTNGRKLVCDRVWTEKDLIFLVVQDKNFVIEYGRNEIDMKKSLKEK